MTFKEAHSIFHGPDNGRKEQLLRGLALKFGFRDATTIVRLLKVPEKRLPVYIGGNSELTPELVRQIEARAFLPPTLLRSVRDKKF